MVKWTLSPNLKVALDLILSVVGLTGGWLVNGSLNLGGSVAPFAPLIGAVLGYAASDLLGAVNTGVLPSEATVVSQTQTVWNAQAKTELTASANKMTNPSEKAVLLYAISVIDNELNKPTPVASATS